MGWIGWTITIVVVYIMLTVWYIMRKQKKAKFHVEAMAGLGSIASLIDGESDEYERKTLIRRMKLHVENEASDDTHGDIYKPYLDDEGDFTIDGAIALVEAATETYGLEDLKMNSSEVPEEVLLKVDEMCKKINKNMRADVFEMLADQVSADVEFHPNEMVLLERVGKGLKIKKKEQMRVIDEQKATVARAIESVEAERAMKELWDQQIQKVNVPGWKDEMAEFMSLLYDKNLDLLMETPDKKVAKDVPGLTESKANVIKKQMAP